MYYDCAGFTILVKLYPTDKDIGSFNKDDFYSLLDEQFNDIQFCYADTLDMDFYSDYIGYSITYADKHVFCSVDSKEIFDSIDNDIIPKLRRYLKNINEKFDIRITVTLNNKLGNDKYDTPELVASLFEKDPEHFDWSKYPNVDIKTIKVTYEPEEN